MSLKNRPKAHYVSCPPYFDCTKGTEEEKNRFVKGIGGADNFRVRVSLVVGFVLLAAIAVIWSFSNNSN